MTAPWAMTLVTRERQEWFGRYRRANPAWGVFHVVLEDGNWKLQIAANAPMDAALLDAVTFFNQLSPSQRRRLGQVAERLAKLGDEP